MANSLLLDFMVQLMLDSFLASLSLITLLPTRWKESWREDSPLFAELLLLGENSMKLVLGEKDLFGQDPQTCVIPVSKLAKYDPVCTETILPVNSCIWNFGTLFSYLLNVVMNENLKEERTFNVLGLEVCNLSTHEFLHSLSKRVESGMGTKVSFVNTDCLNKSLADVQYREVLKSSDFVLPDGIGVRLGALTQGHRMKENLNGTDLFENLLDLANTKSQKIYLLGGRAQVVEKVAQLIRRRYPKIEITGFCDGYFELETEKVALEKIRSSQPHYLFVAMGAPFQENWIHKNRAELEGVASFGVGGLFDFYSGRIPRAPKLLRKLHLEWTYRLYQEPARMWKRYVLGNPYFLYQLAKSFILRRIYESSNLPYTRG